MFDAVILFWGSPVGETTQPKYALAGCSPDAEMLNLFQRTMNRQIAGLTNENKQKRGSRMKRQIVQLIALATLGACLGSGCATRTYEPVVTTVPTGAIVVSETPPPLRHEVIGVAPSPAHVWVQGYWVHRNHRWVWAPGHYEVRPRAAAVWVPGHWDRTSRGWVWFPGHWD